MYPRERKILQFISRGLTYPQIADKFKCSLSSIHTHACNIRKATGLKKLEPQMCKDWLYGQNQQTDEGALLSSIKERGPTQAQLRYMQLLAKGKTVPEIAEQMALGVSTIRNALSQGCIRAKVNRRDGAAIRVYLAQRGIYARPGDRSRAIENTMDDPAF